MDRRHFLCSISKKPILAFFGIPVCCVFAYMPSNSFSVFLCFRIPSGCVCPLFRGLFWISSRGLDFSCCERIFDSNNAKGKNTHPDIHPDHSRYSCKYFRSLDKHTLGALHHGYSLGPHSPVLFFCRFDGLFPSQKKEPKFPLGIPNGKDFWQ